MYKMSMVHTSNTRLRRYNFPPRETNLRASKVFKLSWTSIGQIVSSTGHIYIYIYSKTTRRCKSKNLCTHLIKQPNNHCLK